jgi:16S rRNA (uracil1498-N3)-methyltransferase
MAHHRVFLPDLDAQPGSVVEISGDEAHHAIRVKRLGVGSGLELLNGRGMRAGGVVRGIAKQPTGRQGKAEWVMTVEVAGVESEPPLEPRVHLLAGAPKGPRLEEMIDQLSQVGAASWSPLTTIRTVVSPRMGKMRKAERIAAESAKQCGRAWVLEVGEPAVMADVLERAHAGGAPATRLVLADASGADFEPDGAGDITLLVGPEGGFAESEVEAARRAGASVCRFGVHVMRVETAAVVAAGLVMDAERRTEARP